MGFWSEVGKFLGDVLTNIQVSQLYPTLQAAMYKYIDGEQYYLLRCNPPFVAELEKQGTFGSKTVTLTVLEDGSVHVVESGLLGGESIFPKTAGAPTPQQFVEMLQSNEDEEEWYEDEEELPDVQRCYEILGCDPSVTNDELTRHYRELCQQYHPDRIQSKKLAPDFLEFAEQRFKEIQNAYEIVTEYRRSS